MLASSGASIRRFVGACAVLIGEPSWVLFSFFFVAGLVFAKLVDAIPGLTDLFATTIGQLVANGLVYALVVILVIIPIWIKRDSTYVKRILGIDRRPTRSIVWLPFLLWAAYMGATIIAAYITQFFPWIDGTQEQGVGFENLSQPIEYVAAFVALVVLPPIAEELLFRGYLFGRLRERFGFWLTTFVVSVLFGLVHLQWNVGIDVAVLSVFLCYLRERTGSVWAGMVLHAIKNGLAYFILFIYPLLGMSQ